MFSVLKEYSTFSLNYALFKLFSCLGNNSVVTNNEMSSTHLLYHHHNGKRQMTRINENFKDKSKYDFHNWRHPKRGRIYLIALSALILLYYLVGSFYTGRFNAGSLNAVSGQLTPLKAGVNGAHKVYSVVCRSTYLRFSLPNSRYNGEYCQKIILKNSSSIYSNNKQFLILIIRSNNQFTHLQQLIILNYLFVHSFIRSFPLHSCISYYFHNSFSLHFNVNLSNIPVVCYLVFHLFIYLLTFNFPF